MSTEKILRNSRIKKVNEPMHTYRTKFPCQCWKVARKLYWAATYSNHGNSRDKIPRALKSSSEPLWKNDPKDLRKMLKCLSSWNSHDNNRILIVKLKRKRKRIRNLVSLNEREQIKINKVHGPWWLVSSYFLSQHWWI